MCGDGRSRHVSVSRGRRSCGNRRFIAFRRRLSTHPPTKDVFFGLVMSCVIWLPGGTFGSNNSYFNLVELAISGKKQHPDDSGVSPSGLPWSALHGARQA